MALILCACGGETLDAGFDEPHGLLPVDERNPVILSNDGTGYWYGLYSLLFANNGGPTLAGIAINSSAYAASLNQNLADWQELVDAARASGLQDIPDPIASVSVPLSRPPSGEIEATLPNGSEGARLIVEASSRLAWPGRPLVVAAGGRLTDVADAYLLDRSVTERVVVVASLGSGSSSGGLMGAPNGELDPWADWIVAQRFRYVQVSAYYDSTLDLPSSALDSLPANPLGELIRSLQPGITNNASRSDQVSVLALGLPEFAAAVQRVTLDPAGKFDATTGPALVPSESGDSWLVVAIDAEAPGARLRQLLSDPTTFGN